MQALASRGVQNGNPPWAEPPGLYLTVDREGETTRGQLLMIGYWFDWASRDPKEQEGRLEIACRGKGSSRNSPRMQRARSAGVSSASLLPKIPSLQPHWVPRHRDLGGKAGTTGGRADRICEEHRRLSAAARPAPLTWDQRPGHQQVAAGGSRCTF